MNSKNLYINDQVFFGAVNFATMISVGIFFFIVRACGGYKKTLCPFNHPLEFTDKYDPDQVEDGTVECDICEVEGVKASWHCNCSFDICETCYKK